MCEGVERSIWSLHGWHEPDSRCSSRSHQPWKYVHLWSNRPRNLWLTVRTRTNDEFEEPSSTDWFIYLLWIQSCKAEHADLVRDVLPVLLRSILFQIVAQLLTHGDDTISHLFHFFQPQWTEILLIQDSCRNACTVYGRIRVHWTNDDLDLRHHSVHFVFVLTEGGECTDTFAIETCRMRRMIHECPWLLWSILPMFFA